MRRGTLTWFTGHSMNTSGPSRRWLPLALIGLGALAIGRATLLPDPTSVDQVAALPLTCLVCGEVGAVDVTLNLLLFAPLAAGLALLGTGMIRIFVIAALLSLTIETIQLAWIPGRDASLSDLVTNSIGAAVIGWVVHRRDGMLLPDRRRAGWLTLISLAGWVLLEALAGWSLQPSLPETVYWGQWAPDLGSLDRFRGTILNAAVAGEFLPPHRLTASNRFRQNLLQGAGPVTTTAITGSPPSELAPIVSVFDGGSREIFLLGQRQDEAFFRLRTRVTDLRFRPPAIGIPHAVPTMPGESLTISASYTRGRYWLRLEVGGRVSERTLDATPNWAWSFLMPFGNYALGMYAPWLTALWVAGLLLPIGYWSGRIGTAIGLVGAGITVGLTLALVPVCCELPPIHLIEWASAALGLILGHAGGRLSLRHRTSTTQPE